MEQLAAVRITGCLPKREADRLWTAYAETYRNLRVPFRCGRRRFGQGYALYRVYAPDAVYAQR